MAATALAKNVTVQLLSGPKFLRHFRFSGLPKTNHHRRQHLYSRGSSCRPNYNVGAAVSSKCCPDFELKIKYNACGISIVLDRRLISWSACLYYTWSRCVIVA